MQSRFALCQGEHEEFDSPSKVLPGKSFRDRTKLKALYTRDPKDVGPGIMASPSEPVQKAKELASTTSNTSPYQKIRQVAGRTVSWTSAEQFDGFGRWHPLQPSSSR